MKIVREVVITLALAAGVFVSAKVWLGRHDERVRSTERFDVLDRTQKQKLRRDSVLVDSMRKAANQRMAVVLDSVALVLAKAPQQIAAMEKVPHVRIVTDTLVKQPDSLVSVYVESEDKAFPAHPFLGRLLVWQDSIISEVAIPQAKIMVRTIQQQNGLIYQMRAVIDSGSGLNLAQQVRITTLEQRLLKVRPRKLNKVATWMLVGGAAYVGFRLGSR